MNIEEHFKQQIEDTVNATDSKTMMLTMLVRNGDEELEFVRIPYNVDEPSTSTDISKNYSFVKMWEHDKGISAIPLCDRISD